MDDRRRFIRDLDKGLHSVAELAAQYGISRQKAHKFLTRYYLEGEAGLRDRSRAPKTHPNATPAKIRERLLKEKQRRPRWGPRAIVKRLRNEDPETPWPAPSTVGELFRRNGLVRRRARRRPVTHPGRPIVTADRPNSVWAADFKGQFRTLDSIYCYPLTVTDLHSRFLLACRGLRSTHHVGARAVFERIFREFGLPEAILTDNGSPFASTALSRLSRLSVWWLHLGIRHLLIQPGRPQQNGCHERMHRTLKEATTRPPARHRAAQQRVFDHFRQEFNEERPHQALQDKPPATLYAPSQRPFPNRLPAFEYPGHFEPRRVSRNGGIRWHHSWVNVSSVVAEEIVGLEEIDHRIWNVWLGPLCLGRFDERRLVIVGAPTPSTAALPEGSR